MNTFFPDIMPSLKTFEYINCETISTNISGPTIKSIVTKRNHPSILAIGEVRNAAHNYFTFSFPNANRKEILLEIFNVSTS